MDKKWYELVRCWRQKYRPVNVPLDNATHHAPLFEGLRYDPVTVPTEVPEAFYRQPNCDPYVYHTKPTKCHVKCAVRPLAVQVYNVHYPWPGYLTPGWSREVILRHDQFAILHQKCKQGKTWGAGHTNAYKEIRETVTLDGEVT